MAVGILYESKEWSSYQLEKNINEMGVTAKLIDMEQEGNEEKILACELIVSRIFASAQFRGHQRSLERMPQIIRRLKEKGIPMINPCDAHFYEISKERSTKMLGDNGFAVPKVFGVFHPAQLLKEAEISYPCIIKPNCGGRTTHTFIVKDEEELCNAMENAPDIAFIAEEYIYPAYGFLTRIEVIDGVCRLILKRSVADNGLSAYHLGSTYLAYPDCCKALQDAAVRAMDLLQIETGSLDLIENKQGFYIIDVNAVSNVSEDNTEMFSFDLMKETAAYVVKKYRQMQA